MPSLEHGQRNSHSDIDERVANAVLTSYLASDPARSREQESRRTAESLRIAVEESHRRRTDGSQRGGLTPQTHRLSGVEPAVEPAVEPQPESNGATPMPLVTAPCACTPVTDRNGGVTLTFDHRMAALQGGAPPQTQPSDQPACPVCLDDLQRLVGLRYGDVIEPSDQPACPICLDDLVAPQMLGCGHLYCTKCIATHASVQRAAGRPVNCPCCVRPVAPAELHAWASPPQQLRTLGVTQAGVRVPARTPAPSWNDVVAAYAASRPPHETAEAAAASSAVEAPALSRREQRDFRRAAARLQLRRCPSCDAAVQKVGGCNSMSCLCGASFQWRAATPLVACSTYHYDSSDGQYCCQHCSPAAYAKLGAVRVAKAAAVVPAATVAAAVAGAVVVAGGSVAAAVAVVPAAVFGPLALVYEPIRRTTWLKKHRNGLKMAAASGAVAASYPVYGALWFGAMLICGNESD